MPSQSPIGGFSLIFHIIINVTVFLYRNLKKILNKWKFKTPDKYIEYLFNEAGNTYFRRFLAYFLVAFIFVIVNGTGAYVLFIALTAKVPEQKNTPHFIQKTYELTYDYNLKKPEEIKNITTITASNTQILSGKIGEDPNVSLVENLIALGVKKPSFKFRARLAKEFDVVSDESGYDGSRSQNLIILTRMNNNVTFRDIVLKNLSQSVN